MHNDSPFRKCGICEKQDYEDYFSTVEVEGQLIDICDPCDRERGIALAKSGGALTGLENYAFKEGFMSVVDHDEETGTAISAMAGNVLFACFMSLLAGIAFGYWWASGAAAQAAIEGVSR